MKTKIKKINQSLDGKIKKACEKMPQKKRNIFVLILCFAFVAFFVFTLWDTFQSEGVKELMKIEHLTPLDLPQDTANG
jgi:hypothetical protein